MSSRRIIAALSGAGLLLLAACSGAETDANGWRYEKSTFGDFQSSYGASKSEIDGPGRLSFGCWGGVDFQVERGRSWDPSRPVPARYRFDDGAPANARIWYSGIMFRMHGDAEPDPIYPRLAGARRLDVRVSPPGEEPFTMRFDLTGVDEALQRLWEHRACRTE